MADLDGRLRVALDLSQLGHYFTLGATVERPVLSGHHESSHPPAITSLVACVFASLVGTPGCLPDPARPAL